MSPQRILGGWALVFVLLVAGCSGDDEDAGSVASTTSTAGAAPATAGGGLTTTTAGGASTTGPAAAAIAVVLGPDRLVVGGNALVYGAPRSQVRAYLDRALGAPTATATQECGPGELESFRWKGITAFVAEDGFAGWYADDDTYATERGIRIGSARSAVEASYPEATVEESTLGTEFFVPGVAPDSGLSGVFEDDEVAALWSGATCVAR